MVASLSRITRLIFQPSDDALLDFQVSVWFPALDRAVTLGAEVEEGQRIEPKWCSRHSRAFAIALKPLIMT